MQGLRREEKVASAAIGHYLQRTLSSHLLVTRNYHPRLDSVTYSNGDFFRSNIIFTCARKEGKTAGAIKLSSRMHHFKAK
jgi:hypothetical protein